MAGWCVVMPVKRLALAKTRLQELSATQRAEIALAFADDTVRAVLAASGIVGVVVVTDDARAGQALLDAADDGRVMVVPDTPDAGLNPALAHGARAAAARHPGCAVAALSSDLPALRPGDLDRALAAAGHHRLAFVADRDGSGTTMYAARDVADFRPAFGTGSAAAHEGQGAARITMAGIESLRQDVDTAAELAAAMATGVGPRTTSALKALGLLG